MRHAAAPYSEGRCVSECQWAGPGWCIQCRCEHSLTHTHTQSNNKQEGYMQIKREYN